MSAPNRLVTTATLIRGQLYTLRHPASTPKEPKDSFRFQAGIPVVIDSKSIISLLENLHDEVVDGEGEVFEKPRFRIDRNVKPESVYDADAGISTPQRLSATRKPIKRRRKA